MSKELDYINERIERLEFHIAHPNEYNITPTIKVKINDGAVYKEEVATLKRIKQQLESIDNAKPSEALECLEKTISPLLEPILAEYEDDLSDKITANYFVLKQTLIKSQEDKRFIELILNKPQLLNVFALDGVHTWEEFEDTFSDEDKEYINTTKEEYEYMRNQLIKRGKIE